MNKATYEAVARQINARLKAAYGDDDNFKPRVSVFDTSKHGKYYDKWSLLLNDDLYDLVEYKGIAQDMFYADETYVVGDFDLYLEPITKQFFGLAVL